MFNDPSEEKKDKCQQICQEKKEFGYKDKEQMS